MSTKATRSGCVSMASCCILIIRSTTMIASRYRRWFSSQARYASLEASHLLTRDKSELGGADRLRLLILPAPVLMFFYVLFIKRCLLDGWSGWYYTFQRVCAETMLSIELLDRRLRSVAQH